MANTHCANCGTRFTFLGNSSRGDNGLCVKCDSDRYQKALLSESRRQKGEDPVSANDTADDLPLAAMLVTSETILLGYEIIERHGIVGADVAFGQGPFKDIAVGLSNVFGGRSETMSKMMRDTRSVAVQELKREAIELGANAVIGVSFTVTGIGTNGSMTLMCATGTAVTITKGPNNIQS